MKLTKYYQKTEINHILLADLPALISTKCNAKDFQEADDETVSYHKTYRIYSRFERASTSLEEDFKKILVKNKSKIDGFSFEFWASIKGKYTVRDVEPVILRIESKDEYIFMEVCHLKHDDVDFLVTEIEGKLRLSPMSQVLVEDKKKIEKTKSVFIAHSFDDIGKSYAYEVSRFFSLIGFDVATGESYSPEKVSSKVLKRIERQELVVAILSRRDEFTWLNQETATASALKKPLFILIEDGVDFKPGLLADLEYLKFAKGNITNTFLGMLEGVKEIGYSLK